MILFSDQQSIGQLEKRKGGYFYLTLSTETVNGFQNKRNTRLLCTLDQQLTFQCGLNHLGDGNFFIIISGKNLKAIRKQLGDVVHFELREDPNPLGVDMPEVLMVLLEQDEQINALFQKLSLGKQRHVIHSIKNLKDIDKQIGNAINIIQTHAVSKRNF